MNVDFGANQTQVVEPEQPATTNPQAQPSPEVSVPATVSRPGGLMLGDHIPDFTEIVLPRINISQAIGQLKEAFVPGTLVLDRKVALFVPPDIDIKTGTVRRQATAPATLTIVGFRPTRFAEKVAGGVRGLIVNTEAEVRSNGGTTDYKEWELKQNSGMKLFQHLADAFCLIERPATSVDDDTVFTFAIAGRKYAVALWAMKGSAYTQAAKKVFFTKRSMGSLKAGYPTFSFSVTTRFDQWTGGKEAWVPVCVEKEKNGKEVLDFLADMLSTADASPATHGGE